MANPTHTPSDTPLPPGLQPATSDVLLHITRGCRNVIQTNAVALVIALLISATASMFLSAFLGNDTVALLAALKSHDATAVSTDLVSTIGQIVLGAVVGGLCGQLTARIVVTGSRKQHVGIGEAFLFTVRRLGILVATYLSVALGLLAAVLVCLLLLRVSAGIGALAMFALMIYVVIGSITYLTYVSYTIADDERPGSVLKTLRSSNATWKASRSATLLNLVTLVIAALIVQAALRQAHLTTTTGTIDIASTALIGLGITVIINSTLGAVIGVGFADIYNEVHGNIADADESASATA